MPSRRKVGLLFLVLCLHAYVQAAIAPPTIIIIGITGFGKSTFVNSRCGTNLFTSSSFKSATNETTCVPCGEFTFCDTQGLNNVVDTKEAFDLGAFYSSMVQLLESLRGKNIGGIVFMIADTCERDTSGLQQQIKLLKPLFGPLYPITFVRNCISRKDVSECQVKDISLAISNQWRNVIATNPDSVRALKIDAIPDVPLQLPANWRDTLAKYDFDGLAQSVTVHQQGFCKDLLKQKTDVDTALVLPCSMPPCRYRTVPDFGHCRYCCSRIFGVICVDKCTDPKCASEERNRADAALAAEEKCLHRRNTECAEERKVREEAHRKFMEDNRARLDQCAHILKAAGLKTEM